VVANTTLKAVALVAVPPGVIIVIKPPITPLVRGITSVRLVADTTVKVGMSTLPMRTCVAPVRLVPVIVTSVPAPPLVGVKLLIVGTGSVTTKGRAAELPPPGAGLRTVTS
jgi:hypothetical protein